MTTMFKRAYIWLIAALVFGSALPAQAQWANVPAGVTPSVCPSSVEGCNTPINVSGTPQAKTGPLFVGTNSFSLAPSTMLYVKGTSTVSTGAQFWDSNGLAGAVLSQYANGGVFTTNYNTGWSTSSNPTVSQANSEGSPSALVANALGKGATGIFTQATRYGVRSLGGNAALYARGGNFGVFATNNGVAAGEWGSNSSGYNPAAMKTTGLFQTLINQGKTFAGYFLGPVAINNGTQSGASVSAPKVLVTDDATNGTVKWVATSTLGLGNGGGGSGVNYWTLNSSTGDISNNNLSGQVGIGTNSPSQPLEVAGTIKASGAWNSLMFADRSNAANSWEWYSSGNNAGLYKNFNGASTVLTIDGSGNVGIGTQSPTQPLQVGATTDGTANAIRIANSNGVDAIPVLSFFRSGSIETVWAQNGTTLQLAVNPASYTSANLTAATKFSISNTGNVDVSGTTETTGLRVVGGAPAANKVLAATDSAGNATWKTISEICSTCGAGGITGTANRLSMFKTGGGLADSPLSVWYSNYVKTDSRFDVGSELHVGSTAASDGDDLVLQSSGGNFRMDSYNGGLRMYVEGAAGGFVPLEIKKDGTFQLRSGSPDTNKVLVSTDSSGNTAWKNIKDIYNDPDSWKPGEHCGIFTYGAANGKDTNIPCMGMYLFKLKQSAGAPSSDSGMDNVANWQCPSGFSLAGGDYQSPNNRYWFSCIKN